MNVLHRTHWDSLTTPSTQIFFANKKWVLILPCSDVKMEHADLINFLAYLFLVAHFPNPTNVLLVSVPKIKKNALNSAILFVKADSCAKIWLVLTSLISA
jgi:hypothetical protein